MMMCGHTGSLCDLIIDCKQYAPLQEFYKNAYRHFTSQETEKEFQQTPKSIPQISPQPSVSCRSEDGAKKNTSKISPSMLKHNFYPERRPGRGPKIVKTDLDRTFALSSKKTARCLKQRMEKKKTGGGKLQIPTKGQPKAKKCKVQRCVEFPSSATPAPLPQAPKKIPPTPPDEPLQASSASPGLLPPTSPEILPPASPELGVAGTSHCRSPSPVSSTSSITDHVSLHDTSDDSMGLDDGEINQCIKLPIQKPVLDSWVGVKVSKALTTARGRKTIPFEVYVARVTDYEGNGFAVSFLKEKANGFYVNPETEEIASVLEEELVVLEPPTAVNKQRTFGFQFPDNISSILRDYFFSQGKAINY